MIAPRVYVPDVTDATVAIDATCVLPDVEAHHIARVMRLTTGDPIIVFNGRGASWDAEIIAAGKRTVSARVTGRRPAAPPAPARLTLAVGLLKGDAMDDVVRDATALGVAEIVPMATAHAVVPKRARGADAITRWQRIAVASAKQCGQTWLPAITSVTDLQVVVGRSDSTKLMCVEPALGGAEVAAIASDAVTILIGPEGGWSVDEVAAARAAGCHLVTLGPLTLRAELAPVVAITRVWSALAT